MALFKSTAKFLDTQILVCFFCMQAGVRLGLPYELSRLGGRLLSSLRTYI